MATIRYVKSGASGAANGTSWTDAYTTLLAAAAAAAAGDTIYVSHLHAENAGGVTQNYNFAGTLAAPVKVICANDGALPPTAAADTATVTVTGTFGMSTSGSVVFDGVSFIIGSGAGGGAATVTLNLNTGASQTFRNGSITLGTTSSLQLLATSSNGASAGSKTLWQNFKVKFSTAGHSITLGRAPFEWKGGGLLTGSTSPTALIASNSGTSALNSALLSNIDLSSVAAAGISIFAGSSACGHFVIRNSALPSSWSGSLVTGTIQAGARYTLNNCDSGATNYREIDTDAAGTIVNDDVVIRTGGEAHSWKMTSGANVNIGPAALDSPELAVWNSVTGSSITVTLDILTDSVTALNNDDVWMEVIELGTSGKPLGVLQSTYKADLVVGNAPIASSSATWTTTGLTNPNKQKLTLSFIPSNAGYLQITVFMAKPSTTVWVDTMAQVT